MGRIHLVLIVLFLVSGFSFEAKAESVQVCKDFFSYDVLSVFTGGELQLSNHSQGIALIEKAGLLNVVEVADELALLATSNGVDLFEDSKSKILDWAQRPTTAEQFLVKLKQKNKELDQYLDTRPQHDQALLSLLRVSLPRYAALMRDLYLSRNPHDYMFKRQPWMTHSRAMWVLFGGILLGGATGLEALFAFGSMGWVTGSALYPFFRGSAVSVYSKIRGSFRAATIKRLLRKEAKRTPVALQGTGALSFPALEVSAPMELEDAENMLQGDVQSLALDEIQKMGDSFIVHYMNALANHRVGNEVLIEKQQAFEGLYSLLMEKGDKLAPLVREEIKLKILAVLSETRQEVSRVQLAVVDLKAQIDGVKLKAFDSLLEAQDQSKEGSLRALVEGMEQIGNKVQEVIDDLYNMSQQILVLSSNLSEISFAGDSNRAGINQLKTIKNEVFSPLSPE